MARFSSEFLDDLRARVSVTEIVGRVVNLKKAGREWRGLSPFNKEKTPSFFVNDQKQAWFDFSSGKNGNIFDFLMQTEGLSFPESVEKIAGIAGVALPNISAQAVLEETRRRSLREIVELAAVYYETQIESGAGASARTYLSGRGITAAIIKKFRLGWAPGGRAALKTFLSGKGVSIDDQIAAGLIKQDDEGKETVDRFFSRVIFPIMNERGRVVAFGGRAMGDAQPKYLNSPECELFQKGSLLYNYQSARVCAFKDDHPVIVVEGYVDVIAMVAAGYEGTVASLGTALGAQQLALLWKISEEPVLCFDGDDAGRRAMDKAVDTALPGLRPGRSLRFAVLPAGQDPDQLIRSGGRDLMERVLKTARPLADALWAREADTVAGSLGTPEKRAAFERRMVDIVVQISDEAVRRQYVDEMNRRTKVLLAASSGALAGTPVRQHKAAYSYDDENGHQLYEALVYEDGMSFRRPFAEEETSWIFGLMAGTYMRRGPGTDWHRFDETRYVEWGCRERRDLPAVSRMVVYNLAPVREAVEDERMVWLARSEEVAESLIAREMVATTCAGGTRGLPALPDALKNADVVVLIEHDDAGRSFAHAACMKLRGIARRIRVLDISQFWTGCPAHAGISEWWEAGGTEEKLYELVETLADWKPDPPKSSFGALRFIDIDLPSREHSWLIKGILTQGEMSFLSGMRSSGKSFVALDMAFAVARAVEETDLQFFGKRIPGAGLVLYQAGEGKLGLRKRMRAYRDFHGIPHDRDIPIVLMPKEINLHVNDDLTKLFIAEARAWSAFYGLPIALTVIDTFAKATTGANENAAEDMTRVLDRGQRISEALNCHVQFVHHMNAAGSKVRGHSSLEANVENAIVVLRLDATETEEVDGRTIVRDVRQAKISKQKDDEFGGSWNFVLKQVIVGRDEDGDPITSCVVRPTSEASLPEVSHARRESVGVALNPGRLIFFRDALLAAIEEHGVPPPPSLKLPHSVERVVEWDFVKIAYRKKVAPDDAKAKEKKDTLKTYVKRYREFFQASNIMGVDSVTTKIGETETETQYVWLTGRPVFGNNFVWPRRKEKAEPVDSTPIIDPVTGERMDADLPF